MMHPNNNDMKARLKISLIVMILFVPVVSLYEDEIRVLILIGFIKMK